jgi:hypothetical protein
MKYDDEMGSGAMVCIQNSMKISSGIQKLIGRVHRHREHGDRISLLSFFLNKKRRLITFDGVNWIHLVQYGDQ